jgi:isocitrate dehydrogenase (NAD+)
MPYSVTFIPGDGVGPEISQATRRVLEATGVQFNWEFVNAGAEVIEKYKTPLPENVIESIKNNKVAIKGPVTTPVGYGFRSVNVALRKRLDLYACIRPCKSYKGVPTLYENVDVVIVRENTEDLYAGIEFEKGTTDSARLVDLLKDHGETQVRDDAGYSIKMISETATRRIISFAFDFARRNNRKKVTAIHKANILKFTDGLFLSIAREIASKNQDIDFEDRIVDNMAMQLVKKPDQFDVIVCPNLYGDILSDLCAGFIGGLGLAPGANIGDEYALFEPTHGSAPKYKGLNKVNPIAMILSGMMMLHHLGEEEAAHRLQNAISVVIMEGSNITYDLLPRERQHQAVSTSKVADAIIDKLSITL